jgi:A/G-specific adenine glycosylase
MTRRQQDAGASELRRASRIGAELAEWFARAGRNFPWREWRDEYRLAIAEILLQRTRATTVAEFIGGFIERYPNPSSLAAAAPGELEAALRPIGIQRRRAVLLRAMAVSLSEQPELDWENRPGIGQYISRAIAVGARDAPVAMVDVNFVRITRRAFGGNWMADYRYDRRLQALAVAIVRGGTSPRAVNWAALDLGALVCRPQNPRCPRCPIRFACVTGRLRAQV